MDNGSCIIYSGEKFSLEWYYDKNRNSIAYEYFCNATGDLQDKFLILVKKMGDFGKIYNIKKFRNEGDGIYAFKPQPDRYLSFFADGKKLIVTNGFRKKTNKLPKNEKELALRCMKDYFERKTGGKG
jgi:phage-related protein